MEEAEGFHRLTGEFGLTHEALGYAVSKSRAHVGNMMRLMKLPLRVQEEVRKGTLSFGHARAMLGHPDPESILNKVVLDELSVRETEALVAQKPKPVAPRPVSASQIDAADWERALSQRIGYHVTITANKSGAGQVSIRFKSMLQLEEIVEKISREQDAGEE